MRANAFASAGLFALVFEGLRRQGIAPPVPLPAAGLRHTAPTVPLGRKRDLLGAVMADHGPVAILRVGEAVADHGFHPMLHAMLRARGPADLIGRWLRLERYAHSHHRTVVDQLGEGSAALRHVSLDGPPPSVAEDMLVLGVYLGLLRAIGCRDVAAEVGIGGTVIARPDGAWDAGVALRAAAAGSTAAWRISWSGWEPVRAGAAPAGTRDPRGTLAASFGTCVEAAALAALLADDPTRHLPLADAAVALSLSPRALQRRLAAHGLTATTVGRAVQVRYACSLLAGGDDPLPAVGFVCGFSDQAHFTREFRRRVNLTPGAYRALVRSRDPPLASA